MIHITKAVHATCCTALLLSAALFPLCNPSLRRLRTCLGIPSGNCIYLALKTRKIAKTQRLTAFSSINPRYLQKASKVCHRNIGPDGHCDGFRKSFTKTKTTEQSRNMCLSSTLTKANRVGVRFLRPCQLPNGAMPFLAEVSVSQNSLKNPLASSSQLSIDIARLKYSP
jgi:hypothetical protein